MGLTSYCWAPTPEHGSSLGRQHPEGERLLQVQLHVHPRVTGVTDRDVLADIQFEIAAAGRDHVAAVDRRRPDDLSFYQTLDMTQHGIAFVAAARGSRVGVGAQQ